MHPTRRKNQEEYVILALGGKAKRVYRGSSSSSRSRESSNPTLPIWATFGANVLEHLDKAISLSPDLEEMRKMFANQGGGSGSAPALQQLMTTFLEMKRMMMKVRMMM
ncbi:hypothetical protein LINPERHAP1_LOCUS6201, partial [Linum perenne]